MNKMRQLGILVVAVTLMLICKSAVGEKDKVSEWFRVKEARAARISKWLQAIDKEFCKEDEDMTLTLVEHRDFFKKEETGKSDFYCKVHYIDPDGTTMYVYFSDHDDEVIVTLVHKVLDDPRDPGYVGSKIELDLTSGKVIHAYKEKKRGGDIWLIPYNLKNLRIRMRVEEAVEMFKFSFNQLWWLTTSGHPAVEE